MDDEDVQQFSLRWHNHQSSVVGALAGMRECGALCDVTLRAGGESLRAHRLVLAAASQYFAQLFRETECGRPALVVVLGCGAAELRLLLAFMYTGEVTAPRAALPALLALAATLQVSGLSTARPDLNLPFKPDSDATEDMNQSSPINLEYKSDINEPSNLFNDNSDSNCESKPTVDDTADKDASEYKAEFKNEDRLSKLDKIVQNLLSSHRLGTPTTPVSPVSSVAEPEYSRSTRGAGGGGAAVCSVCHKRLSNQYNLRVHMETHAGRRHACRACSHVSRSRDALRKHVAYRHASTAPRL